MMGSMRRCHVLSAVGIFILEIVLFPLCSYGLGQPRYVENASSSGSFALVQNGSAAGLDVSNEDYPGVVRAAHDLQDDIFRVSGCKASFVQSTQPGAGDVVLIGTIGKSPIIDRLIRERKIDVSQITGKWESTLIQVVPHPLPGVTRGLVIAGSDKRGTIYGIYDLSEQIGVSPWYWWADVPVRHSDALYVKAGRYVQGEPAVKYRGIFLNDEAPALTGLVNEKFGGFNHQFYVKVFELLLRLKANYLWPAMWNSAFNEDDPLNPKLADEYGIVMGTSHHEPMLRAQQEWIRHGKGPWDYTTNADELRAFWTEGIERNKNYESTITVGMRGNGDMPMSAETNVALLERIVSDQRKIITDHLTPTLASDPQVWALYKEVQEYYEKGMRVPDDVTLLWSDDNWGNIRRLPTPEENKRKGGSGIYYHFDYVGDPRNYKWINTVPITKVWEQMNLAQEYGADRIWIVNVGDLKPMEFPIEFFLTFARDPKRWGKDQLTEFTHMWAEREFGPTYAPQIADMMSKYTKYLGRRKPELLEPDTYNLANREADDILKDYQALAAEAGDIYNKLPQEYRDAFYELILYPVKASETVAELYITVGKNRLYAKQGRISTNALAQEARELFQRDAQLSSEYNHILASGKWDHMMDQTHLGYFYWQEPPVNAMPAVTEVQPLTGPRMAIAVEGPTGVQSTPPWQPALPAFDIFNRQSRYLDVFNRGDIPFTYQTSTSAPWIVVEPSEGTVKDEARLWVHIDWSKAPEGDNSGIVTVAQTNGPTQKIRVRAFHPATPEPASLSGFVEANGYVSMEAEHFSRNVPAEQAHWDKIPDFGVTLSGMTLFPVTVQSILPPQKAPCLEYKMFLFDQGDMNIQAILAPTQNFVPGRGLRFAISFDDQAPLVIDALAHNSTEDWATTVEDGVRKVSATLHTDSPGYHTLKFWMVDPGVVLEKLVVSQGKLSPSYLGPPESYHAQKIN
jgi:hypothetical protein